MRVAVEQMTMADTNDTDRKVLRIYLPSSQKAHWNEHAEELGMSQSEFVKAMVQAGRRGFVATSPGEPDMTDKTPGEDLLEDRVLDLLREEHRSWDSLVEQLTTDVENRLETTLTRLQREGNVAHSGRHGGYIAEDADEH